MLLTCYQNKIRFTVHLNIFIFFVLILILLEIEWHLNAHHSLALQLNKKGTEPGLNLKPIWQQALNAAMRSLSSPSNSASKQK